MWFKKNTILVTDDNHAYLMHMSILLKKMGFNVVPTDNGAELLRNVGTKSPDLVLLDINMSGIDGIKILSHLKENDETSGIPVVMISADSSERTKEKCRSLGCEAYLMKPVSIREMHGLVQKCIYAPRGYTRKNLRVLFPSMVSVKYNDVLRWLYSETLSEMGIYVYKEDPFPVGSDVVVTVPLYDDKSISLQGYVAYKNQSSSNRAGNLPGMAIEFTDPDQDKLQVVSELVKGLLTLPTLGTASEHLTA
jgi:CheY-like chemotaxis protein